LGGRERKDGKGRKKALEKKIGGKNVNATEKETFCLIQEGNGEWGRGVREKN